MDAQKIHNLKIKNKTISIFIANYEESKIILHPSLMLQCIICVSGRFLWPENSSLAWMSTEMVYGKIVRISFTHFFSLY